MQFVRGSPGISTSYFLLQCCSSIVYIFDTVCKFAYLFICMFVCLFIQVFLLIYYYVCLYVCLFVCLSIYSLSLSLSLYLSLSLSVNQPTYLPIYVSIYLPINLFVCLFVLALYSNSVRTLRQHSHGQPRREEHFHLTGCSTPGRLPHHNT